MMSENWQKPGREQVGGKTAEGRRCGDRWESSRTFFDGFFHRPFRLFFGRSGNACTTEVALCTRSDLRPYSHCTSRDGKTRRVSEGNCRREYYRLSRTRTGNVRRIESVVLSGASLGHTAKPPPLLGQGRRTVVFFVSLRRVFVSFFSANSSHPRVFKMRRATHGTFIPFSTWAEAIICEVCGARVRETESSRDCQPFRIYVRCRCIRVYRITAR